MTSTWARSTSSTPKSSGSPTATITRWTQWARRYREIIGPPDDPPQPGDDDASAGGPRGSGAGSRPDGEPEVGSLREALERTGDAAPERQLEQLGQDADVPATLKHPAARRPGTGQGSRHGRAEATACPTAAVDRPPLPDEMHEARRLAQRLLRARRLGLRRTD